MIRMRLTCSSFVVVIFIILEESSIFITSQQVPCFFIFGDSLVDNGNNNQLVTKAKANYMPYGVDFPQGPTGRFTNGENVADLLAEFLGFESYIPAFAMVKGKGIRRGVNYGSGAAGIRAETGQHLGDRSNLEKQLLNHKLMIHSHINQQLILVGNRNNYGNMRRPSVNVATKKYLTKCLYYISIGSNDYINNYYLPQYYPTSNIYTPQQYATKLVQQYSNKLQKLYKLGARKVLVSGIGPIGCMPLVLGNGMNGSACIDYMNDAVKLFNDELYLLVDDINRKFVHARFAYTNALSLLPETLATLGVHIFGESCCRVVNSTGMCMSKEVPCPARSSYAFYDDIHPTEIVHRVVAMATYLDIKQFIL